MYLDDPPFHDDVLNNSLCAMNIRIPHHSAEAALAGGTLEIEHTDCHRRDRFWESSGIRVAADEYCNRVVAGSNPGGQRTPGPGLGPSPAAFRKNLRVCELEGTILSWPDLGRFGAIS